MKLLLLFLINIITLSSVPAESKEKAFMESVDKEYQYYEKSQDYSYSNNYFSIIVVQGIYNDKPSYGICFTSVESGKYYALLTIDDNSYKLLQDERKDGKAIAIESKYNIYIKVYDENDNKQSYEVTLPRFNKDKYDITNAIEGNGTGKKFDELISYIPKPSFFKTFIVILLSVTGMSVVLTLILFITKKGLFNKEKRKEGIISMKDLLSEDTNDIIEVDYLENVKDLNNNRLENSNDNFEEPIDEIKDIKAYLRDKGFITEYNALSEEEKNNIMIELMALKDQKKISLNDYYKETLELWKK